MESSMLAVQLGSLIAKEGENAYITTGLLRSMSWNLSSAVFLVLIYRLQTEAARPSCQ